RWGRWSLGWLRSAAGGKKSLSKPGTDHVFRRAGEGKKRGLSPKQKALAYARALGRPRKGGGGGRGREACRLGCRALFLGFLGGRSRRGEIRFGDLGGLLCDLVEALVGCVGRSERGLHGGDGDVGAGWRVLRDLVEKTDQVLVKLDGLRFEELGQFAVRLGSNFVYAA